MFPSTENYVPPEVINKLTLTSQQKCSVDVMNDTWENSVQLGSRIRSTGSELLSCNSLSFTFSPLKANKYGYIVHIEQRLGFKEEGTTTENIQCNCR